MRALELGSEPSSSYQGFYGTLNSKSEDGEKDDDGGIVVVLRTHFESWKQGDPPRHTPSKLDLNSSRFSIEALVSLARKLRTEAAQRAFSRCELTDEFQISIQKARGSFLFAPVADNATNSAISEKPAITELMVDAR